MVPSATAAFAGNVSSRLAIDKFLLCRIGIHHVIELIPVDIAGDKPAVADIRNSQRQICGAVEGAVLLVVQLLCTNQQGAVALHQAAVGESLRLSVQGGSHEHAAVGQFWRTKAE